MKQVISTERIPIKLWLDDIEEGALDQAKNLANLPFAFRHIAIMPDAHVGYGMPIGGVLATTDVIIPNAVGVDIGCGMLAAKINIPVETLLKDDKLKLVNIITDIKKAIPVGFAHNKYSCPERLMPYGLSFSALRDNYCYDMEHKFEVVLREYTSATKQLGTLGGGNHFIEIQKDENDMVWIMIHSGSRNLGKQVADHYNKIAIEPNERYYSEVDKKWQLAFLPLDTPEANAYITEMEYCLEFAKRNRHMMLLSVLATFENIGPLAFSEIDIHHNYAAIENHFGKNVMVHRKGATLARKGTIGIIPGSQGSASYIVEGLGNPESFNSCSHGAGRKMGRKAAIKTLDLQEELKKMEDKGIIHGITSQNDLDEASSAYKDIDTVIENETDLVKVIHKLTPLAVVKG